MSTHYYHGARIFDRGYLLDGLALQVLDNRTVAILPQEAVPTDAPSTILNEGILSPGFVETQANGGGGILVNDDFSHRGLAQVISGHRPFGTVAMLPTFITDSQSKYHQAIASIAEAVKAGVKGIIGGHFEGPFLNPEKKGTHNPKYLRQPDKMDFACYKKYAEYLQNSIISLAPECIANGTITQLKPFFPQINMAHSLATHDVLLQARTEGLTGITHLYNAMRPMSGRDPGPIGSAKSLGLYCGIIADGVHCHSYALVNAFQNLGTDLLMLVTDSMHTIGAPEIKQFDLMGIQVFVQKDRLVNEHGSLAGAHINLLQCVQNAVRYMQSSVQDALRMAISTPAYYLQRPDLASICQRDFSDIIHLSNDLSTCQYLIQKTYCLSQN